MILIVHFSPKDDNLGELMSTVCSVHVGGWAGVGACSAEGVGGPAGSAGGRLGVGGWSFYHKPSKPVKRHNGPFYWFIRDVAQFWYPPPPLPPCWILGPQTFRVTGVLHFTSTHFSGGRGGGRGFAFYVYKLFG